MQAAVDHSDEKYRCDKTSDCPFTGTTIINKIPWADCPAEEDNGETEESRSVRTPTPTGEGR